MASGCMRPAFAQQPKPAPQPTELEATKLENFDLKLAILNNQAQPFLEGKTVSFERSSLSIPAIPGTKPSAPAIGVDWWRSQSLNRRSLSLLQ